MKNQYDDIHLHDVLIIKNHNPVPINIHFYYNNFIKYLRYIVIDGNVNIVIADLKVLKIVHKLLSKGLMSSYPAAKH
ncbi:hypothetical protein FACS1894166_09640 [Bacilli bacterium]|nr:hypothetical protein FACS1894166_09640 [Bacilli bacterium]